MKKPGGGAFRRRGAEPSLALRRCFGRRAGPGTRLFPGSLPPPAPPKPPVPPSGTHHSGYREQDSPSHQPAGRRERETTPHHPHRTAPHGAHPPAPRHARAQRGACWTPARPPARPPASPRAPRRVPPPAKHACTATRGGGRGGRGASTAAAGGASTPPPPHPAAGAGVVPRAPGRPRAAGRRLRAPSSGGVEAAAGRVQCSWARATTSPPPWPGLAGGAGPPPPPRVPKATARPACRGRSPGGPARDGFGPRLRVPFPGEGGKATPRGLSRRPGAGHLQEEEKTGC